MTSYILERRPKFAARTYQSAHEIHAMGSKAWTEFTLLHRAKSAAMVKLLLDHGVPCTLSQRQTTYGPDRSMPGHSPLGTIPLEAAQELLKSLTKKRAVHLMLGLAERLVYPRDAEAYELAQLFMEQGADPSWAIDRGYDPIVFELMVDSRHQEFSPADMDLLDYMLDHKKIDPNISNADGDTFLQRLLAQPLVRNNQIVAEKFLEAGADMNRFNEGGGLHDSQSSIAPGLKNASLSQLLPRSGEQVKSVLYRAIESHDPRNITWALEHGADATGNPFPGKYYKSNREITWLKHYWIPPLYYAVVQESPEAVALILQKLQGNKEAIQNTEGYNAFPTIDIAARYGLSDSVHLIAEQLPPKEALRAMKVVGLGGNTNDQQHWNVRMANDDQNTVDPQPKPKEIYESFYESDFDALHQHLIQTQAVRAEDWPEEQPTNPCFIRLTKTLATLNRFIQLFDLHHLEKTGQGRERRYSPLLTTWFAYINEMSQHFTLPDHVMESVDVASMEKEYPRFEVAVRILYQPDLQRLTQDAPINDDIQKALVRRVVPIALLGMIKLGTQQESAEFVKAGGLGHFDPTKLLHLKEKALLDQTVPELFPAYQSLILEICNRTMRERFERLKNSVSPTYSAIHLNGQNLERVAQSGKAITTIGVDAQLHTQYPCTIELTLAASTAAQPEHTLIESARKTFEAIMAVVQGKDSNDPRSQYALAVATLCECLNDMNLAMQQLNHGEGHPGLSGNTQKILQALTEEFKKIGSIRSLAAKEAQTRTEFLAELNRLETLATETNSQT